MTLRKRLDRLERQRHQWRFDDCIRRPAYVVRYHNDWMTDRPQPALEIMAACARCGWAPGVVTIEYVSGWRDPAEGG